ncbi:LysR substrate-binding domain-containing protein [Streptomyces sp. TG1A-8]|nr:LysR substrate-binding domain-containing protein [Streptomyces sp. TG1A-8]MDO0928521.1 LysR substrate-binding domain-containing protein [Streptomyces sp. TG1A-8]
MPTGKVNAHQVGAKPHPPPRPHHVRGGQPQPQQREPHHRHPVQHGQDGEAAVVRRRHHPGRRVRDQADGGGGLPERAEDQVTDWARRVVEAAAAFDAGARALRDRRDSRLRVAASMTIAEYLLPGWPPALHAERPGTAVSLLAGNSARVAELLLADEADPGLVEGLTVPAALDSAVVGHDRLIVVTAPAHPWARRRRPVTAGELAATPLILRERGSGTRQALDAALGGPARPLTELSSTTGVKASAVSGAGPSVLSELAVGEELALRRLVSIPVEGVSLRRYLRAVRPTGHRPAGPAREPLSLTRG